MCPRISSWINGHMPKRTGELCTVRHFGSLHLVHIEMMDGVPCAGTWAPWLFASWLRKGMAGWRWTHHGGWRHCACAHLFIPDGSFFLGKKTHTKKNINTHSCTHKHFAVKAYTQYWSAGFSRSDLLNLASDSGTCYWKSWPEFYSFDLGGAKDCKGYQHGRGRQAHIVSLVRYYT